MLTNMITIEGSVTNQINLCYQIVNNFKCYTNLLKFSSFAKGVLNFVAFVRMHILWEPPNAVRIVKNDLNAINNKMLNGGSIRQQYDHHFVVKTHCLLELTCIWHAVYIKYIKSLAWWFPRTYVSVHNWLTSWYLFL